MHTIVNVYLKHFAGTALHQIILCSPYLICLSKAKRREGKPGSDLSEVQPDLLGEIRPGRRGMLVVVFVSQASDLRAAAWAGWVKLSSAVGQQRPSSLEEMNKMRG